MSRAVIGSYTDGVWFSRVVGPMVRDNDDGDTYYRTHYFRFSKRVLDSLGGVRKAVNALVQAGFVTQLGCHCSHCMNDWDCCGRIFPYMRTARRTKRGIAVTVTFARNI